MSLNSSTVKPSTSPRQQTESNLSAAPKKGTTAVHDQSQAEQSTPILSNRAANHSSTYIADELNRSNTPIVEHSGPEKNDRTADTHSITPPATSDDFLKNLKSEAMSGIAESQFKLSVAYEKGEGVEPNKEEAFMWCQSSAELGYAKAQFNLGVMYEDGEGIEKNIHKALMWYERAALQDDSDAQFNLASIHETGRGVEINIEKALMWYQKAADLGDSLALYVLGLIYEEGKGVEVDKEKAFNYCHKAAEKNLLKAQYRLGNMYDDGTGVEINKEKAFAWYHKAAEQGHVDAQFNLGCMYYSGEGVDVDMEKSFAWFLKLAKNGDSEAQYRVAKMYARGEGIKQDKENAFMWFYRAAEKDHDESQFCVGVMYAGGEGVKEDEEKSFIWYHKAAERGYTEAMKSLCDSYVAGQGVAKNLALATYWMMKQSMMSDGEKFINIEDNQLFEFIPITIEKYPEFDKLKSIKFSPGEFSCDEDFKAVARFIRINSGIENLEIITGISSISNDQFSAIAEALKFNTQLIRLEFDGSPPSKEIAEQIEVLLAPNRNIAALRQYVKKHPLIYSAGFPLDIVPIILDEMIVANLKGGHTKEATQNAIDTFLLGVSVKELQEDSKI